MNQKGGWYVVPKRTRKVPRCCVCSKSFKIHHKKHMCRMCGCFMHADKTDPEDIKSENSTADNGKGCTYGAIEEFTDELGNTDGPFCALCVKELSKEFDKQDEVALGINMSDRSNIIRECSWGYIVNAKLKLDDYNRTLKYIAGKRPNKKKSRSTLIETRKKYFDETFKTRFLEMIDEAPFIKNDELFEFCKICTDGDITKEIEGASGMQNEGIYLNKYDNIIYKILSINDDAEFKGEVFDLVMREWYYSHIGFFAGIAPKPYDIYVCKSMVESKSKSDDALARDRSLPNNVRIT